MIDFLAMSRLRLCREGRRGWPAVTHAGTSTPSEPRRAHLLVGNSEEWLRRSFMLHMKPSVEFPASVFNEPAYLPHAKLMQVTKRLETSVAPAVRERLAAEST